MNTDPYKHTHLHFWDIKYVCPELSDFVFMAFSLSAFACLSVVVFVYLLQIASASSEPSAHSGSPSQRHLAGTHCPFLQAKSVVAHVFFAMETKENMQHYYYYDSKKGEAKLLSTGH